MSDGVSPRSSRKTRTPLRMWGKNDVHAYGKPFFQIFQKSAFRRDEMSGFGRESAPSGTLGELKNRSQGVGKELRKAFGSKMQMFRLMGSLFSNFSKVSVSLKRNARFWVGERALGHPRGAQKSIPRRWERA